MKDMINWYYKQNGKGVTIDYMLYQMGLERQGRLHSGLDDCVNIARICIELNKRGVQFERYIKTALAVNVNI